MMCSYLNSNLQTLFAPITFDSVFFLLPPEHSLPL